MPLFLFSGEDPYKWTIVAPSISLSNTQRLAADGSARW